MLNRYLVVLTAALATAWLGFAVDPGLSGSSRTADASQPAAAGKMVWMLVWEDAVQRLDRAKVPGGWFLRVHGHTDRGGGGITFYPDPEHRWNGTSSP